MNFYYYLIINKLLDKNLSKKKNLLIKWQCKYLILLFRPMCAFIDRLISSGINKDVFAFSI